MKKIITETYRKISYQLNWIDTQIGVSDVINSQPHKERINGLLDRRLEFMKQRDRYFDQLDQRRKA